MDELFNYKGFDLKVVNGIEILYEGWIEVFFKFVILDDKYGMLVFFLVLKDVLDYFIVGYNVIEEIVKNFVSDFLNNYEEILVNVLSISFLSVKQENVKVLIGFIRINILSELCRVKVIKKDVVVLKNEIMVVFCFVSIGLIELRFLVLFELDVELFWLLGFEVFEILVIFRGGIFLCIRI